MKWTMQSRGVWEAQGERFRYRAVQTGSQKWTLFCFDSSILVETVTYPVTLGDCKYYAARLEAEDAKARS